MTKESTPVSVVDVLRRQMERTLAMLQRLIDDCPVDAWEGDGKSPAVWQHIYHSLLGLGVWLRWPAPEVRLPDFHTDGADMEIGCEPAYSRELLSDHARDVFAQVRDYFDHLTPENVTEELTLRGNRFTRADLVLGQIRHVQHHVGCMHSQLRRRTTYNLDWIGYGESDRASEQPRNGSPLDVAGLEANVGTDEILRSIREVRER
jgi:DinB family protein